MKRNEDREWYDKGYSDGVKDTQQDARIPKSIGLVCISTLLVFNQYWILGFVSLYVTFEFFQFYDESKYPETSPPKMWQNE